MKLIKIMKVRIIDILINHCIIVKFIVLINVSGSKSRLVDSPL